MRYGVPKLSYSYLSFVSAAAAVFVVVIGAGGAVVVLH
jgi:hypothetical protein